MTALTDSQQWKKLEADFSTHGFDGNTMNMKQLFDADAQRIKKNRYFCS